MIDPSATREPAVAPLPADTNNVASEKPTSLVFGMSFAEQQDVLFETLQSFEKSD